MQRCVQAANQHKEVQFHPRGIICYCSYPPYSAQCSLLSAKSWYCAVQSQHTLLSSKCSGQFIIKYRLRRDKAKLSIFLDLPFSSQSPHLVVFQNYIQKLLHFELGSSYGMLDATSIQTGCQIIGVDQFHLKCSHFLALFRDNV